MRLGKKDPKENFPQGQSRDNLGVTFRKECDRVQRQFEEADKHKKNGGVL